MYVAWLSPSLDGAVGKPSVNSATFSYHTLDPKPDELAMSRVNFAERRKEARTV